MKLLIYALTECGIHKLLDKTKKIDQLISENKKIKTTKLMNILIRTYSQCHDYKNGWNIYKNKISHNKRDLYSYLNTLILCGYSKSLLNGKQIHNDIIKKNDYNILNNKKIKSALINMYGKCGDIKNAEKIWNNIIDDTNKNIFMYD